MLLRQVSGTINGSKGATGVYKVPCLGHRQAGRQQ